jgi:hypothetical protein
MDVGADNFRFTLDDPEKKAQTFRYPKTAELHLDSLDRYLPGNLPGISAPVTPQNFCKLIGPLIGASTNNSTNNCQIQTKRNLLYGYLSRVALTQFNLSWRVATVMAGYNDLLAVFNGATTTILTIPPGYYTVSTLQQTLQTLLRTVTGLSTLSISTIDTQTNPVGAAVEVGWTITTNGSPMAFSSTGYTEGQALQVGRAYRLIGVNRAAAGFTPDYTTTAPNPIIITPSTAFTMGVPNFRYTDYVDIVSQTLTNYKDTKDANSAVGSPAGVIGRVWLTEYPLSGQTTGNAWPQDGMWGMGPMTFTKNWYSPNWSQWSPNQAVSSVDITLLDMFGIPLPWTSTYNTEWSATVTVTE